jgi:hypothetical protein
MERGGREEITKGKVVEHSVQSSESWLVPLIGPSVAAPSKRELQEPEIIDFVVESRYEGIVSNSGVFIKLGANQVEITSYNPRTSEVRS